MHITPFSQACENNKDPIFSVIKGHLQSLSQVVEIGSGTGQHAHFFIEQLPHLTWQTTDQGEYFPLLQKLIAERADIRLPPALFLDVNQKNWPIRDCECIFTANTLHIMSWEGVEKLFTGLSQALNSAGHLYIYGPFNYQGDYTSASNEVFDQHIKSKNPLSGIRDFEKIVSLARLAELRLVVDHAMPANNRLLHFQRS